MGDDISRRRYRLIFAVGAALPLDVQRANRTWDLARALFGAAWLALLAQVYLGYLPA